MKTAISATIATVIMAQYDNASDKYNAKLSMAAQTKYVDHMVQDILADAGVPATKRAQYIRQSRLVLAASNPSTPATTAAGITANIPTSVTSLPTTAADITANIPTSVTSTPTSAADIAAGIADIMSPTNANAPTGTP